MVVAKIAWRNVWRSPRRSLLTLAALALSTSMLLFMFAWQVGSYDSMIHAAVSSTTGELQIMHAGYQDKRDIRKAIEDPDLYLDKLSDMPSVTNFSRRAEAFALADSGTRSYGVLVIGVDLLQEPTVSNIRSVIHEGAYFTGEGSEILLGRKLANNLNVQLGDEIVLIGQGYEGSVAANSFRVQGLIDSGLPDLDRSLAEIPLGTFQDTFFMENAVHRIVINCTSLNRLDDVAAELRAFVSIQPEQLEVLTWDQLVPGLKQTIELDLISGYFFYFLLLVVVAFSIMNTFIMAVMERSHELGILNAIGTTRYRMVQILLMETSFLALCGIAVGLIAGIALTWHVQQTGIIIPESESIMAKFGLPDRIHPKLSWFILWLSPALVFGVTLISSLYPVVRVLRLNPVAAMHDQ